MSNVQKLYFILKICLRNLDRYIDNMTLQQMLKSIGITDIHKKNKYIIQHYGECFQKLFDKTNELAIQKQLSTHPKISAKIKKSSQQKITILNKEILDILAFVKQDVVLTSDQSNDLILHQSKKEEAKLLKQLEQLDQTATPTTVIPDTNSAQKALKEKLRKIRIQKQVAAKNKFTAAKKRHASRAAQSTSLDSGGGGVQTLAQSQNNTLESGGGGQINASQSQIEVGGGLGVVVLWSQIQVV